jgi:hypothetical protein
MQDEKQYKEECVNKGSRDELMAERYEYKLSQQMSSPSNAAHFPAQVVSLINH